ncbi:MAG: hypothetical protein WCX46_01575 [Candidatus Paceibacterota bacterium]
MSSKIKNIIILVVIGIVLVLVYFFFLKPDPAEPNLTTSNDVSNTGIVGADATNAIGADFLATLLNVKSIKLDDSIFSSLVFTTLKDSSIELILGQTEGRPNPFAPIGTDILSNPNTQNGTLTTINEIGTSGIVVDTITEVIENNSVLPIDGSSGGVDSGTPENTSTQ